MRRRLYYAVLFVTCALPVDGALHGQAPTAESARPAPAAARVFTHSNRRCSTPPNITQRCGLEVADAQNLLAQPEYQDEAARVDVWRALLTEAVARADLSPFIGQLRAGAGAP